MRSRDRWRRWTFGGRRSATPAGLGCRAGSPRAGARRPRDGQEGPPPGRSGSCSRAAAEPTVVVRAARGALGAAPREVEMSKDTLTITDNRTGKTYELPIEDGTIRAMDLRQIKVDGRRLRADDLRPGVHEHGVVQEPRSRSSTATRASCGTAAIPIEQLAEQSTYLEIAYLLINGELPDAGRSRRVGARHHAPHDRPREHQGAHGRLPLRRASDGHAGLARWRALSTFYPEAKDIHDPRVRRKQIYRLIAKMPTLAAFAYRHRVGLPYVYPGQRPLATPATSSNMMFKMTELEVQAEPRARARARRAVHPPRGPRAELLARARCARRLARSVDPYSAAAGAASRRSTARSTAARTRPCCACSRRSAPRTTSRRSSRT